MFEVMKSVNISAAHFLPGHELCGKTHGHEFRLEFILKGNNLTNGMLLDFNRLQEFLQKEVISKYDHNLLNDDFANPTAENLAEYFFFQMHDWLYKNRLNHISVKSVCVWEAADSYGKYIAGD